MTWGRRRAQDKRQGEPEAALGGLALVPSPASNTFTHGSPDSPAHCQTPGPLHMPCWLLE